MSAEEHEITAQKSLRSSASRPPFLLQSRSAATDSCQGGLGQLLDLLTGDEMHGLLDNAWDSYTSFCSASVGSGGSSIAAPVSAATAAATKAGLPSCAPVEEGKQQLQDKQQEADLLRRKLNAAVGTAGMLQDQLTDAEAARSAD
ncbi:hypothetical protein OEZ85_014401 [Tetradesmus obliquus]|uniref:Uncharacterized protein n=1 Tax=Tetradesmus obliquus TaxID=3088 RepID=A0ABY8U883_TETOB|nr:hypothetical protein OEZ85_014401 [Tetradesmus obliquus]